MQTWIGTSGYSYPDWVGGFYPRGTRPNRMLDHYLHAATVASGLLYPCQPEIAWTLRPGVTLTQARARVRASAEVFRKRFAPMGLAPNESFSAYAE